MCYNEKNVAEFYQKNSAKTKKTRIRNEDMMHENDYLAHVAEQFAIRGKIINIERINKGYINCTYKVETLSEHNHVHRYILQRINTNVSAMANKITIKILMGILSNQRYK